MPRPSSTTAVSESLFVDLLPLMTAVFLAFSVIGLALPVLPLHVHDDLGLGTFFVGLVTGAQFAASLLSRVAAGRLSDTRGAKTAMQIGFVMASSSGVLYLVSLACTDAPMLSLAVLLGGRGVLGAAESFIITGALSWGLAAVHSTHSGKVISWIGTAMYAAFAAGAPVGSALFGALGFVSIGIATTVVPLLALALVARRPGVSVAASGGQPRAASVLRGVWLPGVGLAFSSIGFGAITAFIALHFSTQGWTPVWLAFTAFACAFIAARVLLGHLPDRLGGARVAFYFVLVEGAGQLLLWLANGPGMALSGAVLTGLGYSLVYPGLGIVAMARVPSQSRGMAMGAYTAFLDLALGIATPILGLFAGWTSLRQVFLVSAICTLCSAAIAGFALRPSAKP